MLDPQIISSENDLVSIFGKPNVKNYTSFFSAANFLAYTNNMIVVRVDSAAVTACAEPSGSVTSVTIPLGTQSAIYNDGYHATFATSENGVTATGNIVLVGTTVAGATMATTGAGYDGVPLVVFTRATGDTTGSGATAHATVSGGIVTGIVLDTAGTLYTIPPIISFVTNSGGVNAAATCTLSGGGVHTVFTISNGGTGYVTSTPVVTVSGGGGTNATFSAHIDVNGAIDYLTLLTPGSGYTSRPTVTVTGAGLNATVNAATLVATKIASITMVLNGSGYRETPVLTITDAAFGAVTQPPHTVNATFTGVVGLHNSHAYHTSFDTGSLVFGEFAAKYPGSLGNAITVSAADAYNWDSVIVVSSITGTVTAGTNTITGISTTAGILAGHAITVTSGTGVIVANATVVTVNSNTQLTISGLSSVSGSIVFKATVPWAYKGEFDGVPGQSDFARGVNCQNDEMHIVIVDRTGALTGAPGTVLEKFAYVSKAVDAKLPDGTNNYYKDVLNERSKYIWWLDHPISADMVNTATVNWGLTAIEVATAVPASTVNGVAVGGFARLGVDFTYNFSGGTDGAVGFEYLLNDQNQQIAYDLYRNAELWDISLVVCGKMSALSAKWVIENVAAERKDCIAFCSPQHSPDMGGAPIIGESSEEILDIVGYRTGIEPGEVDLTALPSDMSGSYGVCDSGYKYQYDRYNDKYWWIPLNGDIAGLCARTDYTNDPWFSPGGFNRGQIKNVVKLAHNPNKAARDTLYKNGVNPVVSFPGQGVVLYGDKTLLAKPSAFDRINVRRLFIVLEKSIAAASKYSLFEMNDSFTRAQFKSMVEPFLRDVQGRRGIIDFRVKCDETNNTGEVIDRNEFVGDIYIKPSHSINFVNLSFIAARTAVSFSEIGG